MKKAFKEVVVILFIIFLMTGCMDVETEYVSKEEYSKLDIQQLHNDYDSNEITAKDKYQYNYYYFTEEIDDVVEYMGDTYLKFLIHSDNKNAKTSGIDISAYFANKEMLKEVKKGDTVTIYCKFKERSIENYMGTSGYSFHSCQFENNFK